MTSGVAADLSHLPTNAKISSFVGTFDAEVQAVELPKALAGADVVVISAGISREPFIHYLLLNVLPVTTCCPMCFHSLPDVFPIITCWVHLDLPTDRPLSVC